MATPGAGKTTFALRVATELMERRVVDRLVIVAPTDHLKTQWATAAHAVGISIDPSFSGSAGVTSTDYQGVALTYAGVAANPNRIRRRVESYRTLVIIDEIHHAGDSLSWGESVREAFEPATRRLALTGTPFRSDVNPIPFVSYAPGADGVPRSISDYSYGYAQALADSVVRPVLFLSYSGQMKWRTRAGDEVSARLGDAVTKDMTSAAWRTALDAKGEWVPRVLTAANRRLEEIRKRVHDAGGLVIASDQTAARSYASILRGITGEQPSVVLSDDPGSADKIAEFAEGDQRWMVAVRMVSEGVDVPRLMVGVYATSTSTPLYFAQAVGRFVRARRRGETASVFLPSIPVLLDHAAKLEVERDHVLGKRYDPEDLWSPEEDLLRQANTERNTVDFDPQLAFEALESDASFDRALFDGEELPVSGVTVGDDEEEFLGIPGLLEPEQVDELLRKRGPQRARSKPEPEVPASTMASLSSLRKELNACVSAYSRQSGASVAQVHADVRRACGGPPTAQASAEQLQQRVDRVRQWAVRGR